MRGFRQRSTVPKNDFLSFVDRSIAFLAQDVPEAYAAVLDVAAGLTIGIRTKTTQGTVWITDRTIEVFGPLDDHDIEVQIDEKVVVDLLDGDISLKEAINSDRLFLIGSNRNLEKLHAGLNFYIRGAIRSHSMQELLEEYRNYLKQLTIPD